MLTKWIKNIAGIAVFGGLLWYLSQHWHEMKSLLKLGEKELFMVYAICLLGTFGGGYMVSVFLGTLKVKAPFWDMVLLQNAATLLNYLPMKFGTIFRANYLKRHYGLIYAHFGVFFVYLTILMAAMAGIIGLAILLCIYGTDGYEKKILTTVFLGMAVLSIFFGFVPLPIPTGSGKVIITIRNFLVGRQQLTQDKRALLICSAMLAINFALSSVRLSIIYHSMGKGIHPGGYLILGALGYVTMFVSLTPGALGIRELVLSSGAVALGVPFEVGLLAAIIDRAIALSWSFVIGGGCAAWLWHKFPADFREAKTISSSQIRKD